MELDSQLDLRSREPNLRIYRGGFTEFTREGISAPGSLPLRGNSQFYLRLRSLPGVNPKPLFGPNLDSTEGRGQQGRADRGQVNPSRQGLGLGHRVELDLQLGLRGGIYVYILNMLIYRYIDIWIYRYISG